MYQNSVCSEKSCNETKICAIYVQNVSLQFLLHSNPKCTQCDNQVQTEVVKQRPFLTDFFFFIKFIKLHLKKFKVLFYQATEKSLDPGTETRCCECVIITANMLQPSSEILLQTAQFWQNKFITDLSDLELTCLK